MIVFCYWYSNSHSVNWSLCLKNFLDFLIWLASWINQIVVILYACGNNFFQGWCSWATYLLFSRTYKLRYSVIHIQRFASLPMLYKLLCLVSNNSTCYFFNFIRVRKIHAFNESYTFEFRFPHSGLAIHNRMFSGCLKAVLHSPHVVMQWSHEKPTASPEFCVAKLWCSAGKY